MKHRDEHARFQDLIVESTARELSATEAEELKRHLEECDSCREDYASVGTFRNHLAARRPLTVTDEMLQDARLELRALLRMERRASRRKEGAGIFANFFARPALRFAALGSATMAIGILAGYALFGTSRGVPALSAQTAMLIPGTEQGGSQITAVHFVDADASDGEVELAFQAVRPMRLKGSPDDPAIQKLLAYALVTEPNAGIRLRTVNTLTGDPKAEADPEIRSALIKVIKYDTNPGVRKEALRAIGKLPMDSDIKKALLYVLANDPNEGIRIDAINTLLPEKPAEGREDPDVLKVLQSRMQNENNNYIRLRTRAALQEVQP